MDTALLPLLPQQSRCKIRALYSLYTTLYSKRTIIYSWLCPAKNINIRLNRALYLLYNDRRRKVAAEVKKLRDKNKLSGLSTMIVSGLPTDIDPHGPLILVY